MTKSSLTRRYFLLGLLILLSLSPVDSLGQGQNQTNARGLGAEAYQTGTIDDVNLFNGNLTLTVPIGSSYSAGGSLDYNLKLYYNSNAWEIKSANRVIDNQNTTVPKAEPDPKANAGLGWRLSFGELYAPGALHDDKDVYIYVAPDGSEHSFYPTLHRSETPTPNILYTRDNSYLRLDLGRHQIHFPNGQIHTFTGGTRGRVNRIEDVWGNYLDISMPADPYSMINATWTITDQYGRSHTIKFGANGQVDYINLMVSPEELGGTARTATYDFIYTTQSIERHRKDNYYADPSYLSVQLLTRINLPDTGGSYVFTYYPDSGVSGSGRLSGSIETAVIPTGGKYRWEYDTYFVHADGGSPPPQLPDDEAIHTWMASSSDGVRKKEIYKMNGANSYALDGVYTYAQNLCKQLVPGGGFAKAYSKTTVTTPENDKTVSYFNTSFTQWDHGLPYTPYTDPNAVIEQCRDAAAATIDGMYLSQEIYEWKNSAYQKVRQIYVSYEADSAPFDFDWTIDGERDLNRRLNRQRVIYLDDQKIDKTYRYKETSYSNFDGLGHYRTTVKGGNFKQGADDARTIFINYNPDAGTYDPRDSSRNSFTVPTGDWLLETFNRRTETENGRTSVRQFCFQQGALMGMRLQRNAGSTSDTDLVVKYVRDSSGLITDEGYFGADPGGANAAGSNLCSQTLSGNQYHIRYGYTVSSPNYKAYLNAAGAVAQVEFNKEIDVNTGLTMSETDPSGVKTQYKYDLLGRVVEHTLTEGNGGRTVYTYTSANPATNRLASANGKTYEADANSTTILYESTTRFDSFGRITIEESLVPTSATGTEVSRRDTGYNAMGWKTAVSELRAPAQASSYFTQYSNFDAFGRPRVITPPDGAAHEIRMTYGGDRSVTSTFSRMFSGTDEANVSKTDVRDLQGRVVKVTEKKGSNSAVLPSPSIIRTNYARDTGASAVASSTIGANFPASAAIDGDRTGQNWGTAVGGGWNDATQGVYAQDWIQVNFSQVSSINRINVFTLRDDHSSISIPSDQEEFSTQPDSGYGITDFDVQYLTSQGWVTVPGGRVTNNNKVMRAFTFDPVTTTAVRVAVHGAAAWLNAPNNYSRIVEIEAFNTSNTNIAQSGSVIASSCVNGMSPCSDNDDPRFPPRSVIDGNKSGSNWGNGGGWNDGTEGQYAADWLQVNFAGTRTIDEINVVTARNNIRSTAPVNDLNETFSTAPNAGYGITYFEVQYLSGSQWVTIPGGLVQENNKVWRQFRFEPITTNAIRVVVRDGAPWTSQPNNYSRIMEIEAIGDDEEEEEDFATSSSSASSSEEAPSTGSTDGGETDTTVVSQAATATNDYIHTLYTYDIGNRVETATLFPGDGSRTQSRSFSYDGLGFLRSETNPENGKTTFDQYDALGRAKQKYGDTKGGVFDLTMEYDRAGRIRSIKQTDNPQVVLKAFSYGNGTTAANRSNGKIVTATRYNRFADSTLDTTVTETYTYGGLGGRVSQRQTEVNNNGTARTFTQGFEYNDLGQVSKVSYPTCAGTGCANVGPTRKIVYGYTSSHLTSIGDNSDPDFFYVSRLIYHPNGLLKKINYPTTGAVTTISWQQDNDPSRLARPLKIYSTGLAQNWSTGNYAYDGAGNVKSVGVETTTPDRYYYDGLGRLKQASVSNNGTWSQTYTYDNYGNMTAINTTDAAGAQTTRSLPADVLTNRLNDPALPNKYSYDQVGNLTKNAGYYYEYDVFNSMKTFKEVVGNNPPAQSFAYIYTANGERIQTKNLKDGKSVWKIRDLDDNLLREWEETGATWAWKKDYIHNGRDTLVTLTPGTGTAATQYFFLDHLGSPRLIVDKARNVLETHKYLPFGDEAVNPVAGTEPVKFTGHERDNNAAGIADDLDYMHARYYSSRNGRFLSIDPVLNDSMSGAGGWSRYSYVGNNPINRVDPAGESWVHMISGGLNLLRMLKWQGTPTFSETITVTTQAPAPAYPKSQSAIENSKIVREYFYRLFARAQYGHDPNERAAWLIVDNNSEQPYSYLPWDYSATAGREDWTVKDHQGNVIWPTGRVAVFHTHPNPKVKSGPEDFITADKTMLPVYVIHRSGIWKVLPKNPVPVKLAGPEWLKEFQ